MRSVAWRNVQPTCHPGVGYYLPWVQQISRWSVDIPPNSSSRKTQHAIYLLERLCLSLNRKRAAPNSKIQAAAEAIRKQLGDYIDEFLNDYLTANPLRREAKR